MAAKGATLLHHLAVWMIEENKGKEASSANNSIAIQTRETLPPATTTNVNQGPVYENLADLKRNQDEHLNYRAEITTVNDALASSASGLSNVRINVKIL